MSDTAPATQVPEPAPQAEVSQDLDLNKEDTPVASTPLLSEDATKLRELNAELAKQEQDIQEDKSDIDARSIYVGNVDYGASPEELQKHFQSAGLINRVTILLNKLTGQPKGFAYIEFKEPAAVTNSLVLNDTVFRGRNLKVTPKRTNIPGYSRGRGRGRGRGFRGRFRGRGRFNPY